METQLIQFDSNNNSSINASTITSSNSNNNIRRIGDDTTLLDLIRSDRSLVIFLLVLGFYIDDERNSYGVKIVARVWQASLLLFGGIGFCWLAFIEGGYNIAALYGVLTSSSSKSIDVFIQSGLVLYSFIVPLVQVASVIYGIKNVHKHMDQPVNATIVSPLLASCKKSTLIYFVLMTVLVIVICPFIMTRSYYDADDGNLYSYSLYVFNQFTDDLFFNLSVACYLSVVLLFTSLTMMHINAIQDEMMAIVSAKSSSFDLEKYLEAKGKIVSLKNTFYFSTQLLTFTAGINTISLIFMLWYGHYWFIHYTSSDDDDYWSPITYSTMIINDLNLRPYLLKGNLIIIIIIIIIIITIATTRGGILLLQQLLLQQLLLYYYNNNHHHHYYQRWCSSSISCIEHQ